MIRVEAVFTELIFEHSLRIRMIASTGASTSVPTTTPAPPTLDTPSADLASESEHTVQNTEATGVESALDSPQRVDATMGEPKSANLLGKLNNLVGR